VTDSARPAVRVRRARQDDAALLLSWRNDPEVRGRSRSTDEIDPDAHAEWLRRTLASPDRHLLVVETDPDGTPVGTVRYDRLAASTTDPDRERWEISISVASAMRGRGAGSATVRSGDAWLLATEADAREIVAHVRPDNADSRRLFERNGYVAATSAEPDMDCFVRRR
jgi:RimJ/RimL family protein N-acetyltransferase